MQRNFDIMNNKTCLLGSSESYLTEVIGTCNRNSIEGLKCDCMCVFVCICVRERICVIDVYKCGISN